MSNCAAVAKNGFGRPESYRKWNHSALQKACQEVNEGCMSVRSAAEEYDIPRSTLHNHVTGKVVFDAKSGPLAYLSSCEEEELISFLTCSHEFSGLLSYYKGSDRYSANHC